MKSHLSSLPQLVDILGSDWINRVLLIKTERKNAHALFWLLLDLMESQKLDAWLTILKFSLYFTKFQGIINTLKRMGGNVAFYSFLSEIEVLSHYMSKRDENFDVEYEPCRGDIKITLNGSEVFLEIARLFSSENQERIDRLKEIVWEKLDYLENNKYVLSFGISAMFSESDVNPFVEFVSKKVTEEIKKFPSKRFVFDNRKAWFKIIMVSPRDKGYVGSMLTSFERIESARRLKDRY